MEKNVYCIRVIGDIGEFRKLQDYLMLVDKEIVPHIVGIAYKDLGPKSYAAMYVDDFDTVSRIIGDLHELLRFEVFESVLEYKPGIGWYDRKLSVVV